MAKRKGRCRPKVSSLQKKVKQNSNVETVVLNNPSNELEVAPDVVEEQENQSNELEDDPDSVEEQETGTISQCSTFNYFLQNRTSIILHVIVLHVVFCVL
jgi:hypothetical protein